MTESDLSDLVEVVGYQQKAGIHKAKPFVVDTKRQHEGVVEPTKQQLRDLIVRSST